MTSDAPHSANGVHPANVGSGDDQQQSTTPIGLYPLLRAKRSDPRFRCRPSADWATPRPPPPRVLEALATPSVLGTRRRTISWRDGLLRYARNDGERLRRYRPRAIAHDFDLLPEVASISAIAHSIMLERRLDRAVDSLLRHHHSLGTPLASSSGIIYNRKTPDLGGEHGNARTS
jgi:hypothetical protein